GFEIDLIDDRWIEQLVETARDSSGHRYAVHVVGVLRVLAADVDFPGGRAGGTGNRLLQDLRRRICRRPVVLILFEPLVAAARIDREWYRRRDGDALKADRDRRQREIDVNVVIAVADRDGLRLW